MSKVVERFLKTEADGFAFGSMGLATYAVFESNKILQEQKRIAEKLAVTVSTPEL